MDDIQLPYDDFYFGDWITGTAHLSHQQRGIYITLYSHAGTLNGRGLPNDFTQLCRIADIYDPSIEKMEELKKDLTYVINDKFTLIDGKYHQNRQRINRLRKVENIKNKKNAGSKGGFAKGLLEKKLKQKSSKVSDSESESLFNNIWGNLKNKRGSKPEALKKYIIHALEVKPEILVEKYNSLCSSVEDEKYIPHFSKWLKDHRWEEELPSIKEETPVQTKTYKDYVFAVKKGMRLQYITDDMVSQMRKENLITEEEFKRW